MQKFIKLSLIVLFIGGICFSCSDAILEEGDVPRSILSEDNLYVDLAGFQAGLNGLRRITTFERRGDLRSGINRGPNFPPFDYYLAGTDDCFQPNRNPNQEHTLLTDWGATNSSEVGAFAFIWEWLYQAINSANTIIVRAENPNVDWAEEEKNAVVGEARLIRAWAYRHLTYLWGDVPLVLEPSTSVKLDFTRHSLSEIYASIEEDLVFAENNMPMVPEADGRPSGAAAKHYLAELYILQGRPADAIAKADEVINSGEYRLVTERYGVEADQPGTPFSDMFRVGNSSRRDGNSEVLWSFEYDEFAAPRHYSAMKRWFNQRYDNAQFGEPEERGDLVLNGGRGLFRLGLTSWALQNYDDPDNDDRFSEFILRKYWITSNNDSIQATTDWATSPEETFQNAAVPQRMYKWPGTRKWEEASPNNPAASTQFNDLIYLRLGETYCLKAEAQALNGDLAGAAATLNVLRARAGTTPLAQADLNEVLDERSRELWGEEQRRYTLLRHNLWLERTRLHNVTAAPNITERDRLYPIPQSVIDANIDAEIRQNPDY